MSLATKTLATTHASAWDAIRSQPLPTPIHFIAPDTQPIKHQLGRANKKAERWQRSLRWRNIKRSHDANMKRMFVRDEHLARKAANPLDEARKELARQRTRAQKSMATRAALDALRA